ncbi:MAG: NYN domain-containing protein [Chloroflexi bacterium]|nr:NYN domain-containing protein [Chloroflexota bacterium]
MPILIDGHNLIGQVPTIDLADPDDEAQLVLLLRRYATRRRGRRLIVVFDRGSFGHPQQLNGYGVEAHFARSPADADAELIKRIRAIKRRDEWLVVSSDRAVAGEARARGIPVVSAQEFARRLAALDQPRAALPDKRSERPISSAEVEEWMRFFGYDEAQDGRSDAS